MRSTFRLGVIAGLGALLTGSAAWADAADGEHGVVTTRERGVSHNEDGTVTIDRSFGRLHERSGRTATGDSTTTRTRTEAGVEWDGSGSRTTLRGRSYEGEASGSRVRNEDGSVDFERSRSVTNPETGASRSKDVSGTRSRDGEGGVSAEGTRAWTRTDAEGETRTRTVDYERDRSVTKNDDGSVTIDRSYEKTHQESGKTASGLSSTLVTRGEDGASWETTGSRSTFDGRTLEGAGSGSRTRSGDGSVDFQQDRSVTNSDTGASRTQSVSGNRTRNGDGTGSFRRDADGERRRADGTTRSRRSETSGEWSGNDRGGRDGSSRTVHTNDRGGSRQVDRQSSTWRDGDSRGSTRRVERSGDTRRSKSRTQRRSGSRRGR